GVAISTVRSQIGSMRAKTGAESIRALVRQVAVLPPVKGVLRRHAVMPIAGWFAPRLSAA
ncbi:MAG: helix-turn-helix transcriptional regulator, partial [Caldimonas sp.]